MNREYSEDNIIEQTVFDLFFHQWGRDTLLAFNKESYGEVHMPGEYNSKLRVIIDILLPRLMSGEIGV